MLEMVASGMDWVAVGSLSAAVVAVGVVGGFLGRATTKYFKSKEIDEARERKTAEREAQKAREELRLRQAIVGRPADEYGPAVPGVLAQQASTSKQTAETARQVAQLVDQVGELARDFRDHKVEDTQLAKAFHDHVHNHNGREP